MRFTSEIIERAIIEPSITKLVWEAPHRDPETIAALRGALGRVGTPLAAAIDRVVGCVADDLVDPAVALPALAEACATLIAGLDGTMSDLGVEAALHQLEILQPRPQKPSPIVTLHRR